MSLSCGSKVLKLLITITNAIVCVSSVFFLVLAIRGLATQYIPDGFPSLPDVHLNRAGLVMLAIFSLLTFLISFLGCFGALSEKRGMLLAYSVIMLFFIILIIAAQIAVASSYNSFEKGLDDALSKFFKNETHNSTVVDEFKHIETLIHCCGPSEELKKTWIEVGGCKNTTAGTDWKSEPVCSKVLAKKIGTAGLVVTLLLLFAAIIAMGAACCLRSAIVDRGSYTEFS